MKDFIRREVWAKARCFRPLFLSCFFSETYTLGKGVSSLAPLDDQWLAGYDCSCAGIGDSQDVFMNSQLQLMYRGAPLRVFLVKRPGTQFANSVLETTCRHREGLATSDANLGCLSRVECWIPYFP